jgi:hypothetical protein
LIIIILLASTGTYWCCTQNKDAWVIFDLKHQYNISGMRIIGWYKKYLTKKTKMIVSDFLVIINQHQKMVILMYQMLLMALG